jgi:hypothetical protein
MTVTAPPPLAADAAVDAGGRAAASERAFRAARSTAPAIADDRAAGLAAGRELGRDTLTSWHAALEVRAPTTVPTGPLISG